MKNIKWIFLLIVLVFTGDRVAGWLLDGIAMDSRFRYSRLYRGDADCEILLIGNSRGLIFYQPYIEERTGYSTCNLSYNGMPMDLAKALIMDHLDRYTSTDKLLLDVSLIDKRMDDRLITGFNLYTPHSERLSRLLRHEFPESYYAGFVTNLYRYNSEVFQRALYYWNRSDKDWLLDRVISPTMQEAVANQDSFYFDYTPEMLKDLAEVVAYARQKDVEVALMVNPYYPPFAERMANLDELIADIEKATNQPVHNYAVSIQGTKGFGDYQHLNKNGARNFLDMLVNDGILTVK